VNFPFGVPVAVSRGGVVVGSVKCAWDPAENRLYGPYGADVAVGDVLGFRGLTRRVSAPPELWQSPFTGWKAGAVFHMEDAPTSLPDLGSLLRPAGRGTLNETTGQYDSPTAPSTVWSGACLVEPAQSDGTNPEIGDQQVGVVPFVVTVPLEVTDIRVGDLFDVTSSRDGRLVARTLSVKAIRASSTALTRELLAFDNQGG
jgi:hypothetical protein